MGIENLRIRSVEPDDCQALQELHEQPQVIRGTMQLPFPSIEAWRKRVVERPDNHRVIVACIGKQLVGCLWLAIPQAPRRRHVGELGLVVHDAWSGRGIGTRLLQDAVLLADRWLNLPRLELTVYADNSPAIALYEKFAFKREGRFERYAFRDGVYVDALAMARIRPLAADFMALPPAPTLPMRK